MFVLFPEELLFAARGLGLFFCRKIENKLNTAYIKLYVIYTKKQGTMKITKLIIAKPSWHILICPAGQLTTVPN